MAGSAMTFAYDENADGIQRVVVDWTSDSATGAVSGTSKKITGTLLKAVTIPSATAAPSANYDVAIKDENSLDVLSGLGGVGGSAPSLANRHASNTEVVHLRASNSLTDLVPGSEPHVCDRLTVEVTNAGNSKQGQIILYFRAA